MPLTDKTCKNAPLREKAYRLTDAQGLYLQVMPNGSKYWRLKYRFAEKEKCLALGVYPETSLIEAREKRAEARRLLASGKDPSINRKEQKYSVTVHAANTFDVVAKEWYERNKERWSTDNFRNQVMRRLENDVFPEIGKLPIANIRPIQVLKMLQKIEDRGAHEVARRAMQYCSQIFRYAVITERTERDPTVDLKRVLRPTKGGHYAAIESDEIPEFLRTLQRNDARLFAPTRRAIQLLMLTFVRTSELIKAEWDEFDLDGKQWLIPAERMKMRRAHIVPLSDQACDLLREQFTLTGKWQWVFPNQAQSQKHMSNMTILKALERMGYKGRMTGHGFRALAMSTIKEKLNYRHEVVDRQLAHAHKNQIDAAYDRAQFLPERRKMMQEWADYLASVIDNGKVIVGQFRTR